MPLTQSDVLSALKKLFLAVLVYAFLILCLGYEFGNGDQTEIIPLLKQNLSKGYFAQDFFVQNYLTHGHGVRKGMVWLADLGDRYFLLDWWFFMLHAFFSVIMILGAMTLLRHFTKNRALIIAVICIVWGLMFGINLGSNEIYYAQILPSVVAKSMLIWSLVFYLRNKIAVWPALVILASMWQDMAAIQIFLLLTASTFILFITPVLSRKATFKKTFSEIPITPNVLFIVYICIFFWLKIDLLMPGSSSGKAGLLTDVLLWRVGHHFDPSTFGLKNYLIFSVAVIIGLPILYKRSIRMFTVCILIIAGCILYTTTYKYMPSIILTQWFKTTIWLKFVCFGMLFIFLMEFILKLASRSQKLNLQAALLTLCLVLGILKGPLKQAPYQLPFTSAKLDDDIKIAQLAAHKTTKSALFLIPPDNSTFKIWSKRSCYIDYKSTVFDGEVLAEWLKRITLIYGVTLDDVGGFKAYPQMRAGYNKFVSDPSNLLRIGATHFISEEVLSDYDLLGVQGRWRLYRVRR